MLDSKLLQTIKQVIDSNTKITFTAEGFFMLIRIERLHKGKIYYRQSLLPDDHLYDDKVIDCIIWMDAEIANEIKSKL